jgi:hypothetical protein
MKIFVFTLVIFLIKILKSIAYLIYDALDYGNKFENEPDLQSSLADLLLLISGN